MKEHTSHPELFGEKMESQIKLSCYVNISLSPDITEIMLEISTAI